MLKFHDFKMLQNGFWKFVMKNCGADARTKCVREYETLLKISMNLANIVQNRKYCDAQT